MTEPEEAPIARFYKRLQKSRNISDLDLPLSTVWYIRAAIESRTGVRYTIEHLHVALWLEGLILPSSITRIPEWYIEKYMDGKVPNFKVLKARVTELYNRNCQLGKCPL